MDTIINQNQNFKLLFADIFKVVLNVIIENVIKEQVINALGTLFNIFNTYKVEITDSMYGQEFIKKYLTNSLNVISDKLKFTSDQTNYFFNVNYKTVIDACTTTKDDTTNIVPYDITKILTNKLCSLFLYKYKIEVFGDFSIYCNALVDTYNMYVSDYKITANNKRDIIDAPSYSILKEALQEFKRNDAKIKAITGQKLTYSQNIKKTLYENLAQISEQEVVQNIQQEVIDTQSHIINEQTDELNNLNNMILNYIEQIRQEIPPSIPLLNDQNYNIALEHFINYINNNPTLVRLFNGLTIDQKKGIISVVYSKVTDFTNIGSLTVHVQSYLSTLNAQTSTSSITPVSIYNSFALFVQALGLIRDIIKDRRTEAVLILVGAIYFDIVQPICKYIIDIFKKINKYIRAPTKATWNKTIVPIIKNITNKTNILVKPTKLLQINKPTEFKQLIKPSATTKTPTIRSHSYIPPDIEQFKQAYETATIKTSTASTPSNITINPPIVVTPNPPGVIKYGQRDVLDKSSLKEQDLMNELDRIEKIGHATQSEIKTLTQNKNDLSHIQKQFMKDLNVIRTTYSEADPEYSLKSSSITEQIMQNRKEITNINNSISNLKQDIRDLQLNHSNISKELQQEQARLNTEQEQEQKDVKDDPTIKPNSAPTNIKDDPTIKTPIAPTTGTAVAIIKEPLKPQMTTKEIKIKSKKSTTGISSSQMPGGYLQTLTEDDTRPRPINTDIRYHDMINKIIQKSRINMNEYLN